MSEKKTSPKKGGKVADKDKDKSAVDKVDNEEGMSPEIQAERSGSSKTPQSVKSESKTLKRKLFSPGGGTSEDEAEANKKTTPKRRRSVLAGEASPPPGSTTPKGGSSERRLNVPLSERQQMALLLQMTAAEEQQGDTSSPRPSSPPNTHHTPGSGVKKTPIDKKVNKRNERGETPLHLAAIRGDGKQTKRLLKAGADVNVKDFADLDRWPHRGDSRLEHGTNSGWTPLHEACNHGWLEVAKQLLKSGANVNVNGLDNDTPLHDAAINGHPKLVELLLRHGANPLQHNSKGKSPLDVAANPDIFKLLKKEILDSSSGSSSTDEARSPTSPESNASDREDERKLDSRDPSLALGGGKHDKYPLSHSSVLKRLEKLDKGVSPRLTLKFQHIKTKENKNGHSPLRSKSHRDSQYKSYSVVTVESNEDYNHAFVKNDPSSPANSSLSQDSDLYDPHLERSVKRESDIVNSQPGFVGPVGASGLVSTNGAPPQLSKVTSSDVGTSSASSATVCSVSSSFFTSEKRLDSGFPREASCVGSVGSTQGLKAAVDSQLAPGGSSGSINSGSTSAATTRTMAEPKTVFDPHFEDISDEEEGGEEPMEVDCAPSSAPPLTTPAPQPLLHHGGLPPAQLPPHIPHTSGSNIGPVVAPQVRRTFFTSKQSDSVSHPHPSHPPSLHSSDTKYSHGHGAAVYTPCPTVPLGHFSSSSMVLSDSHLTDKDRDMKSRLKESQHIASLELYKFEDEDSGNERETKSSPKFERERDRDRDVSSIRSSPKSERDCRFSPKMEKDSRSPKNDRSSPKFDRDRESKVSSVKLDRDRPLTQVDRERDRVSPKLEREGKLSPKSEREHRHSPKMEKEYNFGSTNSFNKPSTIKGIDCSRNSPKLEREELSPRSDKDRPTSPKVPPLKIIIKTTSVQPRDGESLKSLLMKPALPYVLNPTQEGGSAMEGGEMELADTQSGSPVAQTTARATTGSPSMTNSTSQAVSVNSGSSTSSSNNSGSSNNNSGTNSTSTTGGGSSGGGTAGSGGNGSGAGTNATTATTSSSTATPPSTSPSVISTSEADPSQQPPTSQQQQQQQQQQQPSSSDSITNSSSHRESPSASSPQSATSPVESIARRTRNKEREVEREKEREADKDKDGKDKEEGEGKDKDSNKDDQHGERRITRSAFRSQQQQQQGNNSQSGQQQQQQQQQQQPQQGQATPPSSQQQANGETSGTIEDKERDKENTQNSRQQEDDYNHPRKRKLRQRAEQGGGPEMQTNLPPLQHHEKPENPYQLYLAIRRQIACRRQHWEVVQPKAPQGFKDYLLVNGNYVLEGNTASRLAAPMLSPPNSVTGPMRDLFIEQEKMRYKLRLQHVIEREKLMLSIEQEILRVHGRAARALANQGTPLSFCAILKDENIYNPIEAEQEEKEKNVRSRYNGRQFLSWLQDVDDKYEKIKEEVLLRHHHEAESLFAVQKLEWEWKLKDAGACDYKSVPTIDDLHVPMVQVNDDFDLLPA